MIPSGVNDAVRESLVLRGLLPGPESSFLRDTEPVREIAAAPVVRFRDRHWLEVRVIPNGMVHVLQSANPAANKHASQFRHDWGSWGIGYQVSGIRYQVSGIRYQVSGIG